MRWTKLGWASLAVAAIVTVGIDQAVAQRSGQNATISVGKVVKLEKVKLQSEAARGAILGGALAYQVSGNSRSSRTKWARAAAGAVAGGAMRRHSEGDLTGMMYTVETARGLFKRVISDQTEIRQGDCVVVEEIKDKANVRRVDSTMCEPDSAAVLEDLAHELQEEALECQEAKEELVAAETGEAIDLVIKKIKILCNM